MEQLDCMYVCVCVCERVFMLYERTVLYCLYVHVRMYVYWCVQVKFQRKQLLLLHSSDTVTDLEDYSDTVSWLCEHASLVLTTGIRAYVHTYVHVKGPVLMLLVTYSTYSAVVLFSL